MAEPLLGLSEANIEADVWRCRDIAERRPAADCEEDDDEERIRIESLARADMGEKGEESWKSRKLLGAGIPGTTGAKCLAANGRALKFAQKLQ